MTRMIDVIGVPYCLGGMGAGTRAGPSELVNHGLIHALEYRGHNVTYADLHKVSGRDDVFAGFGVDKRRLHHVDELLALIPLLARQTGRALIEGSTPLVVGGDHSLALGSVGAALHPDYLHGKTLGLVWIDAHYDAHTELTTHTGYTHGMPLAVLLGQGSPRFRAGMGKNFFTPSQVVHVGAGVSDCEPEEIALLERLGVATFPESVIDAHGWYAVYRELHRLAVMVDALWISFDLDVACASDAPGVYYRRTYGGLAKGELLALANWLAHTEKVVGMDIVEYDPSRDMPGTDGKPVTAKLAIEFACQLLK